MESKVLKMESKMPVILVAKLHQDNRNPKIFMTNNGNGQKLDCQLGFTSKLGGSSFLSKLVVPSLQSGKSNIPAWVE